MPAKRKPRITRQRQVILDEVRKTDTHPTADELYLKVRKRLPRISLGTVYRNLELLSDRAMVRKIEFAGRQKRFDGSCKEHDHVRCLGCGRIDDVPGKSTASVESRIRRTLRYDIIGHRLEFVGYCPRCRKRRSVRSL